MSLSEFQTELRLEGFNLLQKINEGGMGSVWHGTHRATKKKVAVKMLQNALINSDELIAAFHHEVRAIAHLNHPGVVEILDYGVISPRIAEATNGKIISGTPYLVMEYVEGHELFSVSSWNLFLDVMKNILETLAYCHARGVIHRDLKPENLLYNVKNLKSVVKLVDFGIAAMPSILTNNNGFAAGTPAYMAPEQIVGDRQQQGAWTDLYSLGCVAYQLLTGKLPYIGSYKEIFEGHLSEPFPQLKKILFPTPNGLQEWIDSLTKKLPFKRCMHAADAWYHLKTLEPLENKILHVRQPKRHVKKNVLREKIQVNEFIKNKYTTLVTQSSFQGSIFIKKTKIDPSLQTTSILNLEERIQEGRKRKDWQKRLERTGFSLLNVREPHFCGREEEISQLWDIFKKSTQKKSTQPSIIWLHGLEGVGTSTLAEFFTERLAAVGAANVVHTVLQVRKESLRSLERAAATAIRSYLMSEKQLREFITLHATDDGFFQHFPINSAEKLLNWSQNKEESSLRKIERFALISHAFAWAAKERPLVIWIGDLDNDSSIIEFLSYAFRTPLLRKSQILFLITSHEKNILDKEILSSEIEVKPFDPDEIRSMIEGFCDLSPEIIPKVINYSLGLPLAAVQLLTEWAKEGILIQKGIGLTLDDKQKIFIPKNVQELWTIRLASACKKTMSKVLKKQHACFAWYQALEIAATFYNGTTFKQWQDACACAGIETYLFWINEIKKAGLITFWGERWSFSYSAIRDLLRQQAKDGKRLQKHHENIAKTLATQLSDQNVNNILELAYHQIHANQIEPARRNILHILKSYNGRESSSELHQAASFYRKYLLDKFCLHPALDLEAQILIENAGMLTQGENFKAESRAKEMIAKAHLLNNAVLGARARLLLAHAYIANKQWQKAADETKYALITLQKVHFSDSTVITAIITYTQALTMLGRTEEVLILLKEQSKKKWDPQDVLRLARAESIAAYHAKNAFHSLHAVRTMHHFINTNKISDRYRAFIEMAVVFQNLKQFKEAETAYLEALKLATILGKKEIFNEFSLLIIQILHLQNVPTKEVVFALIEESVAQKNALIKNGAHIIWLLRVTINEDWDAWDDIFYRLQSLSKKNLQEPSFKQLLTLIQKYLTFAKKEKRASNLANLLTSISKMKRG